MVPLERIISCNKTFIAAKTPPTIVLFKENETLPPLDLCLFPAEKQRQKIRFQTGAVEYLEHDDIAILFVQFIFILLENYPPPFSYQSPFDELQWIPSKNIYICWVLYLFFLRGKLQRYPKTDGVVKVSVLVIFCLSKDYFWGIS